MVKKENYILNTFLQLTNMTYPYGYEVDLFNKMRALGVFPKSMKTDEDGNYYYKIGESKTVFASHLDTVSKESKSVVHVFEGDMIKTDGKTILGADDKAGVTVMLYMIKNNIPGLYYFFIGEEVGCIGSKKASKYSLFKEYDRIISFDRRDVNSVITHQSYSRCCSDEFADALASELNKSGLKYIKDDGGVYTDSAEFTDVIAECTNLSVGYYREHTNTESQDIEHLKKLASACLLVNWESLPVKRDKTKHEYKDYFASSGYESDYRKSYNNYGSNKRNNYGYADWNDELWEEEYGKFKNASSFKKDRYKKGKEYYDNGSGLLLLNSGKEYVGNHYSASMDKFLNMDLTKKDLEIIKEQYLDMEVDNDRLYYSYLLGNVV